jgi:hypothetical protein
MLSTTANRRNFLLGSAGIFGAAAPLALLSRKASAQTPSIVSQVTQALLPMNELYIQAFIRDPSNPPFDEGYVGLDGGDGGIGWMAAQFDAICEQYGLYQMSWDMTGVPPLSQANPAYLTFLANRAQFPLKHDFFTLLSVSSMLSEMGVSEQPVPGSGLLLQQMLWNGLVVTAAGWRAGDYALLRRRGLLVPAFYQQQDNTVTQAAALGAATGTIGIGLFNAGGGVTTLSALIAGEAVVGGAAAIVATCTGAGLIVLAFGILGYGAYRLFTQKQGRSGPWYHAPAQPGDPAYLIRLNTIPPLFPPSLPDPAPPATITEEY